MSTKNFQFFARPDECLQLLRALADADDLWLVVSDNDQYRQIGLEELTDRSVDGYEQIFIATSPPSDDQLEAEEVVPAKFGWLHFDIPTESGNLLFLADFALKSDWYDEKSKKIIFNKQLVRVYRKLRSRLRDLLKSPVYARNIKTGGTSRYSDMGFSQGAKQWEQEGGELRQRGVENVRFSACGN